MVSSTVDQFTILVINPNSSASITDSLRPLLTDLTSSRMKVEFYTAPPEAPTSIDDESTSALSTSVTFPALQPMLDQHPAVTTCRSRYSAYLVACFSPHPLTPLLRARTTAPVLNIFEAALLHARALAMPFGIVTTGKYWEAVLEDGAREFFHGSELRSITSSDRKALTGGQDRIPAFVGVRSTGLNAVQLHSTKKEEVDRRIADASADLVGKGAKAIILGCAGMSGMENAIRVGSERHGQEVRIIDGVRAGIVLLEGLVKAIAA